MWSECDNLLLKIEQDLRYETGVMTAADFFFLLDFVFDNNVRTKKA